MGTRVMSDETKAKIAATRTATRAAKEEAIASGAVIEKPVKVSLEDQLAAIAASANAGNEISAGILGAAMAAQERAREAKQEYRLAQRAFRRIVQSVS